LQAIIPNNIFQHANLVNQADSQLITRGSSSMETIAIVTLFFLPITTVATIFGTQFFNFENSADPKSRFSVSRFF
jgi:Mg2+ and Co2+ transporter CorA